MARAAVLPPSPVKRAANGNAGGRKEKTVAPKKGASTVVSRPAAARTAAIADSDDTDDELGMMMEEPTPKPASKPAKPRGRPARPATKTTTSTRGKKTASAPAPAEATTPTPTNDESNDESVDAAEPEPPKKRVGRPRKNAVPEDAPAKSEAAPKPRGRPKGSGTKSTTKTTRKGSRKVAEADTTTTDNDEPKHLIIATNSTTMRSNILRGPAKKKTVTFQDVSDSDAEDAAEPFATAAERRKMPARNTGTGARKTGLGATPVRKATKSARGRKPATEKKAAAQPLSPKKEKQIAKSLSAYASSDGEEDELSAAKDDFKSPVKLVVHSPTKPSPEHGGLSSPVRRVNFTPKKASFIDENGEPKLPTPRHGSAAAGLSSPVRKINFTPNRSHHAVADNGHLALSPGKSIDFSDSVFMSSPARRPEASPFQFTLRDTPHKAHAKSIPAPNFTPDQPSLLKASPKKGHLAASFSGSPSRSTPALPARSSLFLSPAKRSASPLKSSLFPSAVGNQGAPQTRGGDVTSTSWPSPPPKPTPAEESAVDQDLEMVEEVGRDIFGIEINFGNSVSSESRLSTEVVEPQIAMNIDLANARQNNRAKNDADNVDTKLHELEEEIRREPDDMGTICFGTMEELQEPFQNLEPENDVNEEAQMDEVDYEYDAIADERTPEPEAALDYTELVEEKQVQSHNMPSSPSEPTLGLIALEEVQYLASGHEAPGGAFDEDVGDVDHLHAYDEEEAESEDDVDNDEPTLVPSEATFTISSQPHLPYEVRETGANSPLRLSVPPFVPNPPVREVRETTPARDMPSNSPVGPSSTKSIDRLFDINYEPRAEAEEDSLLDTTQSEIPTPRAPRASETPRTRTQRESIGVDLGFTPLAQQFGGWEASTPSHDRPTRPRRRGFFSLVGPLAKPIEDTTLDAGDVSYPDLSRTSLSNTPRLFAELPHSVESDRDSIASPAVPGSQLPITEQGEDMMDSPTKSVIFEDPEPAVAGTDHALSHDALTPETANAEDQSDDDKENGDIPFFIPPTTPIRSLSAPRTVHTVSKVPLKAEGEVSPLKFPRKRGLSLSNASPTCFSPRIRVRNSPRVGSPSFSPHKVPRVERSPSPKRRCSTPRRSSVKLPAVTSKSTSVTPSPSKTPRRPSQQALRGAVVHVDVHTTEGEDASGIFVELLQQMGARCMKSWSWNPSSSVSPVDGQDPKETSAKVGITHVVYKDGGLRTLEKVKHAAGLVKCVGVGWVLDCERENKWLDETPYAVDSSIIPRGGAKRRKSMEPRALNNVNGTLVRAAEPSTPSASGRRCGADWGAMESFRKITPPVQAPATPEQASGGDRYQVPQTPGYNFANLDAIGMSPATPYFLSSRAQLVQQSCPPKQSQQGLFAEPRPRPMSNLFEDDDDERRKQRARMETARRKTNIFKPAVGSPLGR